MGISSNGVSKRTSSDPQTGSPLHLGYGRFLRTKLAARDPFYCLNEVFALAASSEKQLLNLIKTKLEQAILDHSKSPHDDGLETLRYLNALLYRYARRIKTTLSSVNSSNNSKWPKADEELTRRARAKVELDLTHLYKHADALRRRY